MKVIIPNTWSTTLPWRKSGHVPGSVHRYRMVSRAITGRKKKITTVATSEWVRSSQLIFSHPSPSLHSFHLTRKFFSFLFISHTLCHKGICLMEKANNSILIYFPLACPSYVYVAHVIMWIFGMQLLSLNIINKQFQIIRIESIPIIVSGNIIFCHVSDLPKFI